MKSLPYLLAIVAILLAAIAGLYIYYLYVPAVAKPALSGEYINGKLTSFSGERQFSFYKPGQLPKGSALVFVLHASRGSGTQVRRSTGYGFDVEADTHPVLIAYPNGFKKHWNDCRKSATYAANLDNIDDVDFLRDMIAFFAKNHGIDPARVYITGHSNGGQMAYRVALEAPDMVAAIAPISASLPVAGNLGCKQSGKPVSVAIFNGTLDPVNPYEGGLVELMGDSSRGEVMSTLDTAAYWNQLAGITEAARLVRFPESDGNEATAVVQRRWQNREGVQVRLYTLEGSGHVVPSKTVQFARIVGPAAGDLAGPKEILAFFRDVERSTGRRPSTGD